MFTIGVDVGTSAVKVIVMNESGEILRTVSRDYPLYLFGEGCSEQAPEDWWTQTADALRELTKEYADISAISFSGQMHGMVALDGNGNVLRRAILWNDQRTVKECEYLNDTIGREVLLANAANIALTGFTLPKILWVKNNEPGVFAKIKMVMLPKDYIAYKLTGIAASDYSDASGTLLLDVKKCDWSDKMLEIAELTRAQVPKLFASFESVGTVTEGASKETGLPTSCKVVIGGGDQAVGAIGTGTVEEGTCSVSLGTSGVLFVAMDEFAVDNSPAAIHAFAHATGRYHMMGVTLAAAGSFKWWMKTLETKEYKKEEAPITNLGENKIYYLPYLSGERTPHNNPNARGAFVGMTMATTRAEMTQAVLEGVAFSLRDILVRIRALGKKIDTARIIGGGASSPLWCQIVADVLNVKVQKIHSGEGPALGAAILAMVGAGAFASVEGACAKLIRTTDTFTPNADAAKGYDAHYKIYTNLYEALKPMYNAISEV
ncbi:MAG: xylulokinase [Defluviitaleaceae bacterium]|nr:xylulokinase [Defluviitaleaceae bacterium]MCL2275547.1 xylulokinase [Defluviitaleaceae bacterium]